MIGDVAEVGDALGNIMVSMARQTAGSGDGERWLEVEQRGSAKTRVQPLYSCEGFVILRVPNAVVVGGFYSGVRQYRRKAKTWNAEGKFSNSGEVSMYVNLSMAQLNVSAIGGK
ncbi:hypothetical protein GUJ93_ZPchr0002g26417 [Zizania palustris]|uniref:Uncharacterized protein n=1 Tax=Zizania palustris TaxID=103762 RepID=A0A8J5S048_ZIZPA|nr:hypothetical protein GUJ93_ZPchr0002g26417 [Zizania palustris]